MRRRLISIPVLAAAMMLAGATQAQAVLKVNKAPAVSGPMELSERQCNKRGLSGVVIRICTWEYAIDPAATGDVNRLYAVRWFQVHVKPRRGRCVTRVKAPVRFDNPIRLHSHAPRKTIRRKGTKRFVPRLVVRGATGSRIGGVSQRLKLRAGRLSNVGSNRANGAHLESTWNGRSRGPVGLAYGGELSIPFGASDAMWRNRVGVRWRGC